jgi:hypothetical protein
MWMEWDPVMRVLAALEEARVEYVVIGGVAVNFHGIARATMSRIRSCQSPPPKRYTG